MTNTTYTLTKEELQELINQAVITVTSSIQLIPELISENELSKRLNRDIEVTILNNQQSIINNQNTVVNTVVNTQSSFINNQKSIINN